MGKRLLEFFLFSNLFIAACALVMSVQTFNLVLHRAPDPNLCWFIVFATICSYSFHWYLATLQPHPSNRYQWSKKYHWLHLVMMAAGAIGAAIYFFRLLPYWWGLAISAVMTFLYSAPMIPHPLFRSLRKVALGKTIFLAMVWMQVTTVLPIIVSEESWRGDFMLFVLARFFLIYAICILFDYRDREEDRKAGIRSLITYLDPKKISYLFFGSLIIFGACTIAMTLYQYRVIDIAILLLPGLIAALLFSYAKKQFNDFLYYLVLDGLMALSAAIMLIPGL